ncbi:hypothetical protein V8J82_23210 [Gymnodinialimonas sp. 2305UL16-5]|uniref:hypothetical protein n=1 Tax=Gymnodinialimonas mytili TaxID=3126503 RepID=UPI0030AAC8AD
MAAFESQEHCERIMAAMDPIWQDWLMTNLKLAAWTLYQDNPQSGREAVDELARDYGSTYEHFASFIDEARTRRNRRAMTDEYYARLGERMRKAHAEGTIRFLDIP